MKIQELFLDRFPRSQELRKPYFIAEAGVNHEGSMRTARRLIEEAKEGGADAIKFQAYKAETIASKYSPAYWDTNKETIKNQYEFFKKHDKFQKNEFEQLKKYCDEIDIEFLCTPFDFESSSFLNDLVDVYKISSSDITNKPFIEHICSFNKPIILSTGASTLGEVKRAVGWVNPFFNPLALMHCVINYPTDDENAHLGRIVGLKQAFPGLIIGYSDHTLPKNMETLFVAALLGAEVIEKHFTHDKTLSGNDHYHAMDKNDMNVFEERFNSVIELIGDYDVHFIPKEVVSRKNARRSIVAARNLSVGHRLCKNDLEFKRPAFGISPADYEKVLGISMKRAVEADSPLQWDDLDQ